MNFYRNSINTKEFKDNAELYVEDISSDYKSLKVLEDITMHLDKGEFVSILGPSGCGKSTLFHILSGLLKPDKGEVYINQKKVTGETNLLSYMYQKDLLLPWKKIIDNVALPYTLQGLSKKESRDKVLKYFDVFGLEGFEMYYPSQLSGGMRQRVAMMRTYMNPHDIMLLDEPFGGLDAITKLKMQQWLKKVIKKLDRSILFITHDIEEALYLSDRIYILSNRPATVIKEIDISLNQEDYLSCHTSREFNELKIEIMTYLKMEDI